MNAAQELEGILARGEMGALRGHLPETRLRMLLFDSGIPDGFYGRSQSSAILAAWLEPVRDRDLRISMEAGDVKNTRLITGDPIVDEVERIWVASIPLLKIERLSNGRTMQAEMPVNELFFGRGDALRSDRQGLLISTAKALAFKAQGFVNELEFVLETETNGAPDRVQMSRAVAIAREIVANGAPPDTVKVGIVGGDRRRLRMRFHVRDEARAYVDFRELGT